MRQLQILGFAVIVLYIDIADVVNDLASVMRGFLLWWKGKRNQEGIFKGRKQTRIAEAIETEDNG